jgi:phosphoribosylanthranilate isomerase
VKICCIKSLYEARLAIEYGASAIGLVGPMPSGPGIISDDLISEIVERIPPPIATFLLTSETTADQIINHHKKVNTSAIQIVDRLDLNSYDQIKQALPGIKLIQVIHVINENSIREAKIVAPHVDAILLDSGDPNKEVKELGGTGRIHDWELSREIVKETNIPVFLAGGLTPANIKAAIQKVKPFGVDICSGLRTKGKLDEAKLSKFMNIISRI